MSGLRIAFSLPSLFTQNTHPFVDAETPGDRAVEKHLIESPYTDLRGRRFALVAGRIALASGFLSAVCDRFGLWGPPGSRHAAWGDWPHFEAYVAALNWFAPAALIPTLAWSSTVAEVVFGMLLLVGYKLQWTAFASAILLLLFAATMTMANGVKAPLDYSVFTAAAAALLIGANVPKAIPKSDR